MTLGGRISGALRFGASPQFLIIDMLELHLKDVESRIKVYNVVVTDAELNALIRFIEFIVRGTNDAIDVVDALDRFLELQGAVLTCCKNDRKSAGLNPLRLSLFLVVIWMLTSTLTIRGLLILNLFYLHFCGLL